MRSNQAFGNHGNLQDAAIEDGDVIYCLYTLCNIIQRTFLNLIQDMFRHEQVT